MKKGIENLKKVALWHTELINEIESVVERKKGKKITGWIALRFLNNVFDAVPIIMNYNEIGKEFEDFGRCRKTGVERSDSVEHEPEGRRHGGICRKDFLSDYRDWRHD